MTRQMRELCNCYKENCTRINEIADACEKEQRERTEAENAEYEKLARENSIIQMRMQALSVPSGNGVEKSATVELRECMEAKKTAKIELHREITPATTTDLANTGIIPVAEQEMLKPLRAGLIWDKVGISVRHGLVGSLRWPSHSKATAKWADEKEALTDSKIDYSKLEMTGTRLGIAIPVTREQLYNSEGIVEQVINEEMPQAIVDAINKAVFSLVKEGKAPKGPFVDLKEAADGAPVKLDTPNKALKELAKLKAGILKTGIIPRGMCWVMSYAQKAEFETTPKDAGSGIMICENDKILGLPVFCTPEIEDGYIGLGDFSYLAAGFFGNLSFIVDPYTLSRENSVDFVLNNNFGMVVLRKEAFALIKVSE